MIWVQLFFALLFFGAELALIVVNAGWGVYLTWATLTITHDVVQHLLTATGVAK